MSYANDSCRCEAPRRGEVICLPAGEERQKVPEFLVGIKALENINGPSGSDNQNEGIVERS